MLVLKASEITVPEGRFRKAFNERAMNDLEASIDRIGLLNPCTVEKIDGKFILRAGERRLRILKKRIEAGKDLLFGQERFSGELIPALDFAELDELTRLEIEIEENVYRSDFDWRERTQALARLHELRKQFNPGQTIKETATEVLGKEAVGSQQQQVSDALIVAKHLDDPEVAKAKDQATALKVIKKKAEVAHRAKLAVSFDAAKTQHRLILGKAEEELSKLPANSFDVIVSDPPYGIGADGFGSMSGEGHDYQDSQKVFEGLIQWLPESLYRVAKPAAHCYLFCDVRNFEKLHTFMVLAGWKVFPVPLIWDKCGVGMLPFPENGPRRTHEYILYAWKGNRRTLVVKSDVIRVPGLRRERDHGAQKPVAVYCDLLHRSANPGDAILDCFGGSGTILVAGNNTRTVATYIEMNETYYNVALQRVDAKGFDDGVQEDDGIDLSV